MMTTPKLDSARDIVVRKAMLRDMTLPGILKNVLRISAFALCAFLSTTLAENFKSKVVPPELDLHVNGDETLFIRNFTQEDDGSATRGVVTVTKAGVDVKVLTAAILDETTTNLLEVINSVVIGGPADVAITCGATSGGNCFISYKKEGN